MSEDRTDRTIAIERLISLAFTVEDCGVVSILANIARHEREGHQSKIVSIDRSIADLTRAILILAGTQEQAWRESAVETVAKLLVEEVNNPAVLTRTS